MSYSDSERSIQHARYLLDAFLGLGAIVIGGTIYANFSTLRNVAFASVACALLFFLAVRTLLANISTRDQQIALVNKAAWFIAIVAGLTFLLSEDFLKQEKIVETALALAVAYFAYMQTKINSRIAWFTGAQESHSTSQLVMRAHERGIPVIYWDPTKEKWDSRVVLGYPNGRHRKIAKQPFVVLYVPESERIGDGKQCAKKMKPLSATELREIESEKKRLHRENERKRR